MTIQYIVILSTCGRLLATCRIANRNYIVIDCKQKSGAEFLEKGAMQPVESSTRR